MLGGPQGQSGRLRNFSPSPPKILPPDLPVRNEYLYLLSHLTPHIYTYWSPLADARLTEPFCHQYCCKERTVSLPSSGQFPAFFYVNRRYVSFPQQPAICPFSWASGRHSTASHTVNISPIYARISQAVSTLLIFRTKFCMYFYHPQACSIFVRLIPVFAVVLQN